MTRLPALGLGRVIKWESIHGGSSDGGGMVGFNERDYINAEIKKSIEQAKAYTYSKAGFLSLKIVSVIRKQCTLNNSSIWATVDDYSANSAGGVFNLTFLQSHQTQLSY